ncbi:MAG: hypothetical protein ACRDQ5_05395 [Sciscionella sp.]
MNAAKPVGQDELKRAVIEQIDAAVGHDRTFWRPGEVHNRRVPIGRLHGFVRYVPIFRGVAVSMLCEYPGLMLVTDPLEGMSAVARIRSALAIGYGQRLGAQAVLTSAGFPGVAEFARHTPLQGRELGARRGSR